VIRELPLERRTLHGHFSRDLAPVLTIDPGDSVRFSTPNAAWDLASGERFEPRDEELDAGHALAGPIEVRGARAGQTLVVRIDEVVPASWGVTLTKAAAPAALGARRRPRSCRRPRGHADALPGRVGHAPGRARRPLDDPAAAARRQSRLQGARGRHDALPADPRRRRTFSGGDGHAAQGDGEVSGTAIECPVDAQVTLDVRDDLVLEWPCARIDGAWLTLGFDPHLGRAAKIAVDGMLDLMERELRIGRDDALAFASVVVDLRVTQVVNESLGVHAVLRDDALR